MLAGAGLAGFAVAFSTQIFIRDIINGFSILMENQFQQGDIVQIGGVSAVVEVATDDRFKEGFLELPQVAGPLEMGESSVTYRVVARAMPFRGEELSYELRSRLKPFLGGEGIKVIRAS